MAQTLGIAPNVIFTGKMTHDELLPIVFMPDAISHMLGKVFFKKYEKNYWETLKKITPIHKLSNKYLIPKDYSQTYYEMFKEGKL